MRQDLRFAYRMLVKSPLFTTIVVGTLALGIGLNTAVFSAVEAMVLRPLAGVRAPEELVQVFRTYPGDQRFGSNSIPHFWDIRARSRDVFSGAAAWTFVDLNVTAEGRPQRAFGQMVSADFFTVLGADVAAGRFFVPEEDEGRGAHPVAVLSDAGWHGLFGGDPTIVGREVVVNGQNVVIIGIAAPEVRGVMAMVQPVMWVPLMQLAQMRPSSPNSFDLRGNNFMNVIARLAPGVSIEQANERMKAISAELLAEYPDNYEGSGINLVSQADAGLHPTFRQAQVGLSAAVMAVVALLLLIACVNVANLFLARAHDRAREMAVRLALGARRAALVRQLIVESVCFALVAGLAGLIVAQWAIGLANGITLPVDIVFRPDLQLSLPVLGFALLATLVTGVLFGLAPALQMTRPSLIPVLKGEAAAGGSRSKAVRVLVVAQMALSLILLTSAGLFLANLKAATAVDKGFVSDGLLLAELDPSLQGYGRAQTRDFYRRLLERLAAHPQVTGVGLIDNIPLGFGSSDRGVAVPGYVAAENERMSIRYASVSPGYFATMGVPVRDGREFEAQDDSAAVRRLVVNARFAERFWPDQDAVGRTVRTAGQDFTVIGVVPTGKYERLGEPPTEFMWFVQDQIFSAGMNVVLRVNGEPETLVATLRAEVGALDPNLPVANIRTMDRHLGIALLPARVTGIALGVFGLLGLVLASVGVYGVMAYTVSQRTREIGIRMAIGAAASDVVRLILRQGLALVGFGIVIGLAGAVSAARLLSSVLYGGGGLDPLTFTLVPLVLLVVAVVATWAPARRAASVDPAITLRAD